MSAPGGAWSRGGVVVSQHALKQTPLWTEFLTHATENITLPQTSFAGGKNELKYELKSDTIVYLLLCYFLTDGLNL